MTKKVEFKVTSYEGDTAYSLLPKPALAKIRQLEAEEEKWVFVDGEIKNTELLTEKDLLGASDITLTNAIAGGECVEKPIEINFNIEKGVEGIIVSLTEDDYHKDITVVIGKDNLIDTVHNRKIIVKAIGRKLDEFAEREVGGLRKALNV